MPEKHFPLFRVTYLYENKIYLHACVCLENLPNETKVTKLTNLQVKRVIVAHSN